MHEDPEALESRIAASERVWRTRLLRNHAFAEKAADRAVRADADLVAAYERVELLRAEARARGRMLRRAARAEPEPYVP